jgi:hypothetical protein
MEPSPSPLRCGQVLVSDEVVAEERGAHAVVSVPRQSITELVLARGPRGERLAAQSAFALVLVAVGLASATAVDGHPRLMAGLAFLPFGLWVLWSAWRPSYYLKVHTAKDMRKVCFDPRTEPQEIRRFLELVERVHHVRVEWRAPALATTSAPYR